MLDDELSGKPADGSVAPAIVLAVGSDGDVGVKTRDSELVR